MKLKKIILLFGLLSFTLISFAWQKKKISEKDKIIYEEVERLQKRELDQLTGRSKDQYFNRDTIWKNLQYLFSLDSSLRPKSVAEEKKLLNSFFDCNTISKYQDCSSYRLVAGLIEQIEMINNRAKILPSITNLKHATLLTNNINAESRKIQDEYVLLVNARVMAFCNEMIKLLILTIEVDKRDSGNISMIYEEDDMLSVVSANPFLKKRFIELMECFTYGTPAKGFTLNRYQRTFADPLLNAMEIFIVSHEYAHCTLKHDVEEYTPNSEVRELSHEDSVLLRVKVMASWKNEISADIYANQFVYNIVNIGFPEMTYYQNAAPMLILTCINILERSQYILSNGKCKEETFDMNDPIFEEVLKNLNPDSTLTVETRKIDFKWTNVDHPPIEFRKLLAQTLYTNATKIALGHDEINETEFSFMKMSYNYTLVLDSLFNYSKSELISKTTKNEKD